MGPFMVEIVFCPVTRRGRKKRKGQNKDAITNSKNDGPAFRFIPQEDTLKVTLDLSEDGPVFSALDEMMMKMLDEDNEDRAKMSKEAEVAKNALKNLLKSGIPGIESMFAPPGAAGGKPRTAGKLSGRQKGFHKMTEGSRTKFMKAVFGKDGTTIDTKTAAALLAATYSGGDPQIGENIAQLLVPEMGENVDQNMMAALMSTSSMINAGANIEEVMRCMKEELSRSDLTEEEILHKTKTIMKAFGKEDKSSSMLDFSLVSKQSNSALRQANISPKDFAKLVLCQRILATCGVSSENLAKMMMVQSQLLRRGAQGRHVAEVLSATVGESISKAKQRSDFANCTQDEKLKKNDVLNSVRITQALDNENEPTWKEVKQMKDILSGASTSSAESIGLNLQRALKAAQLPKADIANVIQAQKAIAALNPDPQLLAKLMLIQKTIAENGVPPVEIARVLGDGVKSRELFETLATAALDAVDNDFKSSDVELLVKVYDQLGVKGNIPKEVIEHIDRNLIQVRCSLEDVAENHVNSANARGERETMIARSLVEVLLKTGASLEIVVSTMFQVLKRNFEGIEDLEMIKMIGRSLIDSAVESDDFLPALTSLQAENVENLSEELMKKGMEILLKELQFFPDEIRAKIDVVYPPPPPVEKVEREKDEMDGLTADEIFAKFAKGKPGAFSDSVNSSRRGSLAVVDGKVPTVTIDGEEMDENMAKKLLQRQVSSNSSRRGSFLSPETTKRSSIAKVVDKNAEQRRLLGMSEDEELDENGSMQTLNSEMLAHLKQFDPTNAGAAVSIAQEQLSQGGFVNDEGILCDPSGQAVLDPTGKPVTMDDLALDANSSPASKTALLHTLAKQDLVKAKALMKAMVDEGEAEEDVLEEAENFLSGLDDDGEPEVDYEQMLAMLEADEKKSSKKKKKKGKAEDKLAMLSKMMQGGVKGAKAPQVKEFEKKGLKRVGKVDKRKEILPTEEKKIEATKKWQAPKAGQIEDPDVTKAREVLAKAAQETGTDPEELEQAAMAAGLSPDELIALVQSDSSSSSSQNVVQLLETIQAAQEEEEESDETISTKSQSFASSDNQARTEALLQRMKEQDEAPEDFLASLEGDQEVDLNYQHMMEMMALLDEEGSKKKKKGKSKDKLDMLSKMMKGGVRGSKGPIKGTEEQKSLKRVGKIDKRSEAVVEEQRIEATRKWQAPPGTSQEASEEASKARRILAKAATQTGTSVGALEEAAMASGLTPEQIIALVESDTTGNGGENVVRLLESLAHCDGADGVDPLLMEEAISEGMSLDQLAALVGDIGSSEPKDEDASQWKGMGPGKLSKVNGEAKQENAPRRKGKGFSRNAQKAVEDIANGQEMAQVISNSIEEGADVEDLMNMVAAAQGQALSQDQVTALEMAIDQNQTGDSHKGLSRDIRRAQIEQLLHMTRTAPGSKSATSGDSLPAAQGLPASAMKQLEKASATLDPSAVVQAAIAQGASPDQVAQLATQAGASGDQVRAFKNEALMAHIQQGSDALSPQAISSLGQQTKSLPPQAAVQVALAQGASVEQALQIAKSRGASDSDLEHIKIQVIQATTQAKVQAAMAKGSKPEALLKAAKARGASAQEMAQIQAAVVVSQGGSLEDVVKFARLSGTKPQEVASVVASAALAQGASIEEVVQMAQSAGASAQEISQMVAQITERRSSGMLADVQMALAQGAEPQVLIHAAQQEGASAAEIAQIKAVVAASQGASVANVMAMVKSGANDPQAVANVVASAALAQNISVKEAIQMAQSAGASDEEITLIAAQVSQGQGLSLQRPQSSPGSGTLTNQASFQSVIAQSHASELKHMVQEAKAKGAKPQELAQMIAMRASQSGASAQEIVSIAKAAGASSQELAHIQAATALAQGADIGTVIKQAKASGATQEQLGQLAAMAVARPGVKTEEVMKAAASVGMSPASIGQIKSMASLNSGSSLTEVLKSAKANGVKSKDIVQLAATAALSQGQSVDQVLAQAKAAGVSQSDLDKIAMCIPSAPASSTDASSIASIAQAVGASAEDLAMLSANGMDLTSAILKIAQENGASTHELVQIEAQTRLAQGQTGTVRTAQVINAVAQGANPKEVLAAAKAQGTSGSELMKLEAQMELAQGQSVDQVLKASKQRGASDSELVQIKAAASIAQGLGIDEAIRAAKASGASASDIAEIQSLSASLSLAQSMVSSSVQAGQALIPSSPNQIVADLDAETINPEDLIQMVNKGQVDPALLMDVVRKADSTTKQDLITAAIKRGMPDADIAQLATAAGMSRRDLQVMKELVPQSGLSRQQLAMLKSDEKDSSPQQIAAAAVQSGANLNQALELAKAQGASQEELTQIKSRVSSMIGPQSGQPVNKGLAQKDLAHLITENTGGSDRDLAVAAIALGATPDQVAELMTSQGAAAVDVREMHSQAVAAEAVTAKITKGVSSDKLARIQRRLHGASPADMVEMSLLQGASPAQILELGRSQGFNASQMRELQQSVQKTVQEIIDNGGNINILGLAGQGTPSDGPTRHEATTNAAARAQPRPEKHFGGIGTYEEEAPRPRVTLNGSLEQPLSQARSKLITEPDYSSPVVQRPQREAPATVSTSSRPEASPKSEVKTREMRSQREEKSISRREPEVVETKSSSKLSRARQSEPQTERSYQQRPAKDIDPTPVRTRRYEKDTPASPIMKAKEQLQPFKSKVSSTTESTRPSISVHSPRPAPKEYEPRTNVERKVSGSDVDLNAIRYRTSEFVREEPRDTYRSDSTSNAGLSDEEIKKLMHAFDRDGILISKDGVSKYRTALDMSDTMDDSAFLRALEELEHREPAENDSQRILDQIMRTQSESIEALKQRLKAVNLDNKLSILKRSYQMPSVVDYSSYGTGKSTYVPTARSMRDFESPETHVEPRGPRQRRILPPTDYSDYKPVSWRDMIDLPEYKPNRERKSGYDSIRNGHPHRGDRVIRTPTPVRGFERESPIPRSKYSPSYVPRSQRISLDHSHQSPTPKVVDVPPPSDLRKEAKKILPYTGTLSNNSILRPSVRRRYLLKQDREAEKLEREERYRKAKSSERDYHRSFQPSLERGNMWEHHLLLGLLHVCGASVPSDFLEDVKGLFKESVKDCPNGYVIISSVPLHQNDPTWTELLFDKPVELSDSGLLSTSCALIFSDGSSSIEVISSMIKDLRPFRNQVFLIWDELTPETDWDELGREANARFVVARPSQNRISLNLICPFNPLGAEKRIIWYTSTGVTGNAFQTLLEHCNGIGTTWKAFYRAIKPTVNRPEPGNSMITGLEVDITNLVTEILGNKVDYIMVNQTLMEISKGVRMSNQIFMISQYEGHLGLGLSSLNSRFHPFVDFPPTFLMTKLFYTTRLPAPLPSYQSLVRIFSPVIWGALLGANLVASVVLFRMYQYYQLEPLKTYIRTQKGSLIEFILRMNVTINKPEVLPWFRSFSGGSLLSLVFYVYTMLIGFFYTSELLTVLIRAQREAPIDSPQDILNRGARVYIPDILTLARTGGLYSYAENKGEMPSNSKKDVEKNGAVYIFP
eukprot:maker-scaffold47_size466558-snap-gene-3.44 protein:Tk04187 transcript:maker-scaffold47_size466558-snap-gene-3.44-mRNA-1 annotation:"---NA---"